MTYIYPLRVTKGRVSYVIIQRRYRRQNDVLQMGREVVDKHGNVQSFVLKYPPNAANTLVFIGLCNLPGETTDFRRAEFAYHLSTRQATRLMDKIVRWLTTSRRFNTQLKLL